MVKVKCLSIRQPFAWAIVNGIKRIENRSWATNYRGQLLIHASAKKAESLMLGSTGLLVPEEEILYGGIIGSVYLSGCVEYHEGGVIDEDRFAYGPFCFVLDKPVAFGRFVPLKGQVTLFDVDDSILKGIK